MLDRARQVDLLLRQKKSGTKQPQRLLSIVIMIGITVATLCGQTVGVGAVRGVANQDVFIADENQIGKTQEELKKEKSYVIVTTNEETAEQIDRVFGEVESSGKEKVINETNNSDYVDEVNSSYCGDSTFEEEKKSLEEAMLDENTATVELSKTELEQVQNSDNVLIVEEDIEFAGSAVFA